MRILLIYLMLILPSLTAADSNNNQNSVSHLQRFFTTPFERAQLDAMRRRNQLKEAKQDAKESAKAGSKVLSLPVTVKMKGYMKRGNGKNVVWVNDGSTLKSNKIDDSIRVNSKKIKDEKVSLRVHGKYIKLKPGQVWDETSGKIIDNFQQQDQESSGIGLPAEILKPEASGDDGGSS